MRYFRLTSSVYFEQSLSFLQKEGFEINPSGLESFIFGLVQEPFPVGNSLAHCFGLIYLQDKSSYFPPLVLDPKPGSVVLDLCASPGSKTGVLAWLVGRKGLVIANEPNSYRLATLRQNLRRCNQLNVVTTAYRGELFPLCQGFDYILADVPCSGWGTVEKNPKVKKIWTQDKLNNLLKLQRKLLARASLLLNPEGKLVYSTCTTNEQENEEQIAWAEQELGLKTVPVENKWGIAWSRGKLTNTYQIPMTEGEQQGFFLALLTKASNGEKSISCVNEKKFDFQEYDLDLDFDGKLALFGQKVFFLPKQALYLSSNLRFKGILIGNNTRKGLKIWPGLRCLKRAEHKICISELGELKKIMRGEQITVSKPDGMALLCYLDLPLCWIKIRNKRIIWQSF